MIKNLLFDFGGVLIDADLPRAIQEFEKLGLKNVAELLNLYTQNGFFLDLEEGKLSRSEFCRVISKNVGRDVTDEEVESAWLSIVEGVPLFKLDYLEELKQKGYNLYLLSNINPFVMDWARTSAFSEYRKPLNAYFDKMFCSYEMGVTKPSA
ncbi:MAG: HAD family phosphatase, partial [Paludibacteraceae bacterium]|nr:HAD family phosphatase [Paludibacteraceae bacterium]